MPHCPKCGEQLSGNNSYVSPWTCACGVWRAITYPLASLGTYEIEPALSKTDDPWHTPSHDGTYYVPVAQQDRATVS